MKSSPEDVRWFTEEIQRHEPALRAFLRSHFPSLQDQDDVIQEAYGRIIRAKAAGNIGFPKTLLFTIARNAAFDVFRRRGRIPAGAITDFEKLSVLDESPGVAESVGHRQERQILTEAIRALPARCKETMILRYIDGLSYKEIAARLNTSPETVKVQLAKGMRRCTEFFEERNLLKLHPNSDNAP